MDKTIYLKPKLRGISHAIAFGATVISFILFLISSYFYKFNLGIMIYLISQALLFGISSLYHVPNWSPKQKNFLRYLDHMCIFLLISGTQTSVLLNNIPRDKIKLALKIIKLSWTVSLLGISRLVFFKRFMDIFDLVCYICHGLIIVPFANILKGFHLIDVALIILGGVLYIVGGCIFGLEKPNPKPELFGYHEIFHIFTILGNLCFSIVITKEYFYSVFQYIKETIFVK